MGLLSKLQVQSARSSLDSRDLRPVPKAERTWTFWTWNIFWFSAVTNSSNFLGGSSFLSAGLTLWQGILCNTFGYLLIALFMVANGRPGAVYHIGFPAYCRSSFGIYGSMWPVLNRAVMSCVWQGVNAVSGAQALYVMLHSIFPSIARIPNHMGDGSALTSAGMICFFVFCVFVWVACQLSIPKWGILINVKLGAFAMSAIGLLALSLTQAGGIGNTLHEPSTITGTELTWTIIRFFLLAAAGCSTFASNASDFQRNSETANSPILGQIVGFPVSNFIVTLIGMIISSTSKEVYGELVWNPLTYMDMVLTDNYHPSIRAGCFFIGLGFVYSSVFSAIFENLLPCGNDVSALFPKYLTIRRGFSVCIIASIVICPWYLLGSASIFITVLSSYQIFLFAIIGILLTDYYIVARGHIEIERMYDASRDGPYWYTYGVNPTAFIAYFCGIAVNFAGFLSALGVFEGSVGLTRSYYFSIFTTTFTAAIVYWGLSKLRPQANERKGSWLEPKEYIAPDDPWNVGRDVVEESEGGAIDEDKGSEDVEKDGLGRTSAYVLPAR